MYSELILLIATLAILFYIWQRRTFNFWNRLGIKQVKPSPFFGNMRKVLTARVSYFEQFQLLHNTIGFEKEPLIGIYLLHRPALIIKDLDLIKTVMIKKFNYFTNRTFNTDQHHDPIGYYSLVLVRNLEWRELRNKMSPVFSTGGLKQMYPLMVEIGKDLEKHLDNLSLDSMIVIKNICDRFTTDLIATTVFGIKANALSEVKSELFAINQAMFSKNLSRGIDFAIITMMPVLASLLRATFVAKNTSKFIMETIRYALAEREKSGVQRRDLIEILLAMKKEAVSDPKNKANQLEYLVAQAAVFQLAGFETSASTMTMALYELSQNTEIQDRLRKEIKDYFGEQDHIEYERLQEMPYLTQVVNETLRKYPVFGYVERECKQPETGERFTLEPYYDVELPNGTPVFVSTVAIHRDERYWPQPDQFDPERFAPENRHKLNMDAYMPFGIGPRNCIAMRLGLLQSKLGLVHLLRNHRVLSCEKTLKTIEFAAMSPVISPKGELYIKLEKQLLKF